MVVESIVYFGHTHPEAVQVISLEPGFGVEFVRQVFPEFVAVVEELLTPALKQSPRCERELCQAASFQS